MTGSTTTDLAEQLVSTWDQQGRDGFLLSAPDSADIATREAFDEQSGVHFRFRWMPHREIRGDVAELQRRGILNPNRDESKLFRDPRDPSGRHCFLCRDNIRECHPMERLVPVRLAGQDYLAGANFAWIERDHFTVMPVEHVDQEYSAHALEAMLDLHQQAGGKFRVLFNGPGAGATIPWHMHFQITTASMPIETIDPARTEHYPTMVHRFQANDQGQADAHEAASAWIGRDPENHTVNVLVATPDNQSQVFIFLRDKRRAKATNKGLVGGFEVAGDFVLSAPPEEAVFNSASAELAHSILSQVRPEA